MNELKETELRRIWKSCKRGIFVIITLIKTNLISSVFPCGSLHLLRTLFRIWLKSVSRRCESSRWLVGHRLAGRTPPSGRLSGRHGRDKCQRVGRVRKSARDGWRGKKEEEEEKSKKEKRKKEKNERRVKLAQGLRSGSRILLFKLFLLINIIWIILFEK